MALIFAFASRSWRIAANDGLLWKELFTFNFPGLSTYNELSGPLKGRKACSSVGNSSNVEESLWKKKFNDAVISNLCHF